MTNLCQIFHKKVVRYVYGRSPLKAIIILTLVAMSVIFLSKIQLFNVDLQPNEVTDLGYNPKILIQKKKVTVAISTITTAIFPTTLTTAVSNTTSKLNSVKLVEKPAVTSGKIFSGQSAVTFNISFNLIKDNLLKVAMNDILLKGLNEESQKLRDSLNDKPLDYDKNARFCKCTKISQPCICCVKLAEENIGLTKLLCANLTYLPKRKAARISMQYGESLKSNYDVLVDIIDPPPVCLTELVNVVHRAVADEGTELGSDSGQSKGSANFTLDLCFQAKNLTYNVNMDVSRRTEFRGCSNVNVKLNNMIVHFYPLGCFKAGHDSTELQIQKVANGIP